MVNSVRERGSRWGWIPSEDCTNAKVRWQHQENKVNESRSVNGLKESTGSMRAAFAALYEAHMPRVYRYVLYRVGDVPTAEDLTSTVFEKALNSFHRYSSEQASFPTWLMAIARNTLIDYYRMSGKRRDIPLEAAREVTADDPLPDEEAARKEELEVLRLCISRLSRREQEIISFKFGAGTTNRSIAGLLNVSESNIGVTLYRAVHKLRECFRKWQDGQG